MKQACAKRACVLELFDLHGGARSEKVRRGDPSESEGFLVGLPIYVCAVREFEERVHTKNYPALYRCAVEHT